MNAATHHRIATPIGPVIIETDGKALILLEFDSIGHGAMSTPRTGIAAEVTHQLDAYFAGKLTRFDLPLRTLGTPFQQKVWRALRSVPYGETRSYGDIAREVDSAPRAIGGACGANPIAIIVPCHRITGSGDWIGGFSGAGGCATKQLLIEHEAAQGRLAI